MPDRLPLFPLTAVLFPGTPLPLHIFEPRYRHLLADCLAGDQRFGIIPITADGDIPPPGAVGCIADIKTSQELPDGGATIIVVGASRFVLTGTVDEPRPYLVGLIEPFGDEPSPTPDAAHVDRLRELFAHYIAGLRQLNDVPTAELHLPPDAEALSFNVAAATELELGVKQQLLAERSTARRIDALLALLPDLTTRVERAAQLHHRARGNGKGGVPDLATS